MPQELHNLSNHQQCKGVPVKHCRCVVVIDTQKYSFSRKLWDQKFSSVIQFRSYISKVWDSLIQSRLALNSPLADDDLCLHLKSTRVTGMCHLPSLYFNFKVKSLIIGFICYRNITEKKYISKIYWNNTLSKRTKAKLEYKKKNWVTRKFLGYSFVLRAGVCTGSLLTWKYLACFHFVVTCKYLV